MIDLQALTPYVNTKDYEFAGLARRAAEDAQVALARLDEVTREFAAGLSGLSDELLKRYDALHSRDQRYDTRLTDLSTALSVVQQNAWRCVATGARRNAATVARPSGVRWRRRRVPARQHRPADARQ